jgi:hypothetical protein
VIQRFNFYDVYGYLIPGLALVALLWLPSAAVEHHLQDAKIEWVAAALAVAYVVGHLLQNLAANAVEIKFVRDAEVDKRNAVFALCRPIINRRTPYAEQQQGLYTMSRGLYVAFALCATYMLGWIIATYAIPGANAICCVLIGFALALILALSFVRNAPAISSKRRRLIDLTTMILTGVLLACSGLVVASAHAQRLDVATRLLSYAVCCAYLIVSIRFRALFHYFAGEFGAAVWTTFASEPNERPRSEEHADPPPASAESSE